MLIISRCMCGGGEEEREENQARAEIRTVDSITPKTLFGGLKTNHREQLSS